MATLLLNVLKKELPFEWKEEQQRTFEELKEIFSFAPILKFPDFTKLFEIHMHANDLLSMGSSYKMDTQLSVKTH